MSWKRKTPGARRRAKARKQRQVRPLRRDYAVHMVVNVINVRFIELP